MLDWLANNIGTIAVGAVVAAIVTVIIVFMVKDKKQGKTTCGCGCKDCPMAGKCGKNQ